MHKSFFSVAVLSTLFFALALTGCVTARPTVTETETGNKNITVDNLLKIKKGETTGEEIKMIFGEPNKVTENTAASTSTWTYLHTQTRQNSLERAPFQIDQTQLDVIINQDGLVTEYIQTISNRLKKDL